MLYIYHIIIAVLFATSLIPSGVAEVNPTSALTSLAASCFACHGPQGNSVAGTASLAGLNATYFVERMQGFKDSTVPATVMHQHAKGLSANEILALANYFSTLPRHLPKPLPYQRFQGQP